MSEWSMKRFWSDVTVERIQDGFEVLLDGRRVKTPAKRALVLPTETVAQNVAREWDAQVETVDPTNMPWTRSANAAIDKVATQRAEVEAHLAEYSETDLLCYRAAGPQELIARQTAEWDPLLEWIEDRFSVRLAITSGVMPVEQTPEDISRLAQAMGPMTDFQLTAFHDLVTLSGSFTLALAATEEFAQPQSLWDKSRLDENYQSEQWGEDQEATEHAAIKRAAFFHANDFFHTS